MQQRFCESGHLLPPVSLRASLSLTTCAIFSGGAGVWRYPLFLFWTEYPHPFVLQYLVYSDYIDVLFARRRILFHFVWKM